MKPLYVVFAVYFEFYAWVDRKVGFDVLVLVKGKLV